MTSPSAPPAYDSDNHAPTTSDVPYPNLISTSPLEDVIFAPDQPLLEDAESRRPPTGYGTLKNEGSSGSGPRMRFSTRSIRRGFIRKVFAILAVQLAIVTGLVALFVFQPNCKRFVQTTPWFYILSYVIFVITYFAMALGQNVRRRFPGNMACLLLLTVSMGYMLASIAAFHSAEQIVIALAITVVACLLVVAFTLQSKYDFMGCLAVTYAATTTFFIFGIFTLISALIFYQPVIYMIYCGIAAILFMMYLSIDIYMIVGGKRAEISAEDYTFASVQVFLDIVNIFLLILILIDRR